MDPWHLKNIKLRKSSKTRHESSYPLKQIANLIRVVEICMVLIFVSRFSTELPGAVKNSGEYFRSLKFMLVSPQFVFVIGNVIVITLFVKSGQLSAHNPTPKNDFYDEFVERSMNGRDHSQSGVEFQDKEIIHEEARKATAKSYKRSRSEDLKRRERVRESHHVLRRSESDADVPDKVTFPEDTMSNEEFRRTVEAFIERQQRFLREEEYVVI